MKFLGLIDRIVRPIAIPNLTMIIIIGQVLLRVGIAGDAALLERATLQWDRVIEGEVWRLVTFLFVPVVMNWIFLFFALYLFFIFGNSLERIWGIVRYNTFFWLGLVLTIVAAGFAYDRPVTGGFLIASVFLAFATYNPDFELRLFFVLPIQIKYLAYMQAFFYVAQILTADLATKVTVAASIGNYLIFFAPQVIDRVRSVRRRRQWQARQYNPGSSPRHVCEICGINSTTHPNMDFRYCSKCEGHYAYCEEHLRNHEHK